ncbi:hypothetical protein M514_05886 [Trichuris suis]|uniref:Uncharacterized protein n=1 Tax=Trichuris suis TaxID=68888 RepID=A0A085M7I0_9BILA|nr:hypothetical protein M513_05886 [Trichuris suis]KFD60721.1 hypothetical protein M514_05886 [Trichuris suis]KHJ48457.1 hypothetical protein D918_00759 [Trichuris suis]
MDKCPGNARTEQSRRPTKHRLITVSNGGASPPAIMRQSGDRKSGKSRKLSTPSTSRRQTDCGNNRPKASVIIRDETDADQLTVEAAGRSSSSPQTSAEELRQLQELTGMAALNEHFRNNRNVEVTEVAVNNTVVTFVE